MEYQETPFVRFMLHTWVKYQKFKGASAICAIFLNFFLLIFKLVFCGIALLVLAPHLAALHLISKKAKSKIGNVFRIILYILCVVISLALDIPIVLMALVGVVGCVGCLADIFTEPLLIVPALVFGAIAVLFGKLAFTLIGGLFLKRIPQTAENEEEIIEGEEDNGDDYSEEIEEKTAPQKISIDAMSGTEFEHFCADLLRINGYTNVRLTAGSGDQGVDIIAHKEGVKYAIQCKHYSSPLGNTPVQEVNAGKAIYNCHVGVVLTNSIFTKGAEELAKANNVLLWNRFKLYELIKNAGLNAEYQ